MSDIFAIVPMYKTGYEFPSYVLDAFADRVIVGPCVVIDLLCCRDNTDSIPLKNVIDEAAGVSPVGVAERLVGLATNGHVLIRAMSADELRDRPFAVEALMGVCEALSENGVTVAAVLPWWLVPEEQGELFGAVLSHRLVKAVGVGHCVDAQAVRLVADVAHGIDEASFGRARFVVTGPPPPGAYGWDGSSLSDPERTLVIGTAQAISGKGVADLVRRQFGLATSAPIGSLAEPHAGRFPPMHDIRAQLTATMDRYHLSQPYVPRELAERLVDRMQPNLKAEYAYATHHVDPLSTYLFQDVLDDIVEGDWRPRLEISASGHGINSYAHSYILVVRGLAIAAQVGFGGMREEGEASQEWDRVMQDVSDLLDTYDLCQPHNSDDLVFVAVSDVRGIHHVGLLKHGDTVEVRRSAITAAADPFSDARALIRSHTATGG